MTGDVHRAPVCALLALLIISACNDLTREPAGSQTRGTIVIAATSDPDGLFPPTTLSVEGRQATELIYEYLADVGPEMNTVGDRGFVKGLASGWEWSSDSLSIAFTIDPKAKWHDGVRASSRDVAFSYRIYTDSTLASQVASSLTNVDSVTTPDSATAVFWFGARSPHQFYQAASQMLILPSHVFGGVRVDSMRAVSARTDPVGTGRFAFGSWSHGSHFEINAVPDHHRGRPNADRIIWTITPEYQAAVAKLLGGAADVFPAVRAESIPQLTSGGRFNIVSLPGMDYVFVAFNLGNARGGLFKSRELRRAITMSLDREAMVKNVFDTLANVSIGPSVRAFPSTDTSLAQIPYDTAGASRIFDSLGWRRADAGVRSRNGVPLRFNLIVPVSSLSRMKMAVLIQEQLRRAGIDVRIEQMDYSAFTSRQTSRDFDAALAAWHLGSSPDAIRATWTSAAARKGGLNYGEYRNPRFDALVDSALSSETPEATRRYFSRAFEIVIGDAPAVWLYEPRTLVAVNSRIKTTPMRPNAWWIDIGSWEARKRR